MIELTRKQLTALLKFASKEVNGRPTLEVIHVAGSVLMATDGHRAVRFCADEGFDGEPFSVSRRLFETALRVTRRAAVRIRIISEDTVAVMDGDGIEIMRLQANTVAASRSFATAADIIDSANVAKAGASEFGINPAYMGDLRFVVAASEVSAVLKLKATDTLSPIYFAAGDRWDGAIMPMRG